MASRISLLFLVCCSCWWMNMKFKQLNFIQYRRRAYTTVGRNEYWRASYLLRRNESRKVSSFLSQVCCMFSCSHLHCFSTPTKTAWWMGMECLSSWVRDLDVKCNKFFGKRFPFLLHSIHWVLNSHWSSVLIDYISLCWTSLLLNLFPCFYQNIHSFIPLSHSEERLQRRWGRK